MDDKNTSLESKIRKIVSKQSLGEDNHGKNKSLEKKIREVVSNEEALGTGGSEKGEFKGTPPAFFKSVHIEPKVGDSHPPAEGSAAASRNRAKISSSETMKKEGYIISSTGRVPINEKSAAAQIISGEISAIERAAAEAAAAASRAVPKKVPVPSPKVPPKPTPAKPEPLKPVTALPNKAASLCCNLTMFVTFDINHLLTPKTYGKTHAR